MKLLIFCLVLVLGVALSVLIIISAVLIVEWYKKRKKRQGIGIFGLWSNKRWLDCMKTLWAGEVKINFTYTDKKRNRERRDVSLTKVLQAENGKIYLYGFCHLRNEYRTFNLSRITSKIRVYERKKYFYADEFLTLLGIPEGEWPA